MIAISHVDLLDHVSALERAALASDVDAVHARLCRLRNALVEHLRSELDALEALNPAAVEVVRSGHARLLSRVDDALLAGSTGEGRACACVPRALNLRRAIARQARLESDLVARHRLRRK